MGTAFNSFVANFTVDRTLHPSADKLISR
ncbi:hypothetical protein A2U01_0112808, partial [Trifolium medium]|nr:hypothetical protein [Trifolium medium]